MRIVVVGAGVIGLLTAYQCVRAGAQVDLVDRSGIPAPTATSNDLHRVVRALHRGDAALTTAAARAHEGWLDVERRLGARFYHRVGVLTAMSSGEVAASLAMVTAAGVPAQVLTAADLSTRYPWIRFEPGHGAVLEPGTGAVRAGQALHTLARWLREQPAVRLYPHRQVVAVDAGGEVGTALLADGAALSGDRVVVAAGPWSRALLPAELAGDLIMQRQTMLSYTPPESQQAWAGIPAVLGLGAAGDAWLMPPVAGTPVRLSAASACRTVPEMTSRVTSAHWRDHLAGRFAGLLANFDPAAVTGATEGYYLTTAGPGGPLLASLGAGAEAGGAELIWAYAACGGMSFKFAPLVAGALADRVLGRPPRRTGLDLVDRPRQVGLPTLTEETT